MSDLIAELHSLAQRMAAAGETDEPTIAALAAEEIERLQAEVERLQAEITERDRRAHIISPQVFEDALIERDQLQAQMACIQAVIQRDRSATRFSEVCEIIERAPVTSLAAHDAEVVELFCDYAQTRYRFGLHNLAKEFSQLRQQAQEVQS